MNDVDFTLNVCPKQSFTHTLHAQDIFVWPKDTWETPRLTNEIQSYTILVTWGLVSTYFDLEKLNN